MTALVSSHLISLNSDDITAMINSNPCDGTFWFNQGIEIPNGFIGQLSLIEASILLNNFNIVDSNNTIYYTYNSTQYSFDLPIGYYTKSSLPSALNTGFATHSDITATYADLNGLLTFTSTGGTDFTLDSQTEAQKVLGYSGTLSSISGTAISTKPIDLTGIRRISLYTNFDVGNLDTKFSGFSRLFCNIPITSSFGGLLFFGNPDFKPLIRQRKIDHFRIQMKDEDGNILDLNNGGYTLTFQLDMTPTTPTQSQFLNLTSKPSTNFLAKKYKATSQTPNGVQNRARISQRGTQGSTRNPNGN